MVQAKAIFFLFLQ